MQPNHNSILGKRFYVSTFLRFYISTFLFSTFLFSPFHNPMLSQSGGNLSFHLACHACLPELQGPCRLPRVLAEILLRTGQLLSQQNREFSLSSNLDSTTAQRCDRAPFGPDILLNVINSFESSPASKCRRQEPSNPRVIARSPASPRGNLLYPFVNNSIDQPAGRVRGESSAQPSIQSYVSEYPL
jgi:hypothetical protein